MLSLKQQPPANLGAYRRGAQERRGPVRHVEVELTFDDQQRALLGVILSADEVPEGSVGLVGVAVSLQRDI